VKLSPATDDDDEVWVMYDVCRDWGYPEPLNAEDDPEGPPDDMSL